jgi:hypothetical protein
MKFLKEPLVHFTILSILFFVIYGAMNPEEDQEVVKISQSRILQLKKIFSKTWGRSPTKEELTKIIKTHALDEIYAREAKSYSLDINDSIIRNRLRQKMSFLIEDLASLEQPTEVELRKLYEEKETSKSYRLSFKQVYLDLDKSKDKINTRIESSIKRIKKGLEPIGDSSLLPNKVTKMSSHNIDRKFGKGFYGQVISGEVGKWSGPHESGLGVHFVKIYNKEVNNRDTFKGQKNDLINEWRIIKKEKFKVEYEKDLLRKYEIVVEPSESESI